MAKGKPIEGLVCGGEAGEMARLVLRQRLEEMLKFRAAVVEPENIDAIHDIRVASRRFRSLLRDFGKTIGKKSLKPVARRTKKLAGALGAVRDLDVLIAALKRLSNRTEDSEIHEFLETLIAQRENYRLEKLEKLTAMIGPVSLEVVEKYEDLRNKTGGDGNKDFDFRDLGRRILTKLLAKFQKRESALLDPLGVDELHKLRISAKRFRYSLQLFDPCFGGELKPIAKRLSKIQTNLGEVHDRDVWIGEINSGIETEAERLAAAWIIAEFTTERAAAYNTALENWNRWTEEGIPARLNEILEKDGDGVDIQEYEQYRDS